MTKDKVRLKEMVKELQILFKDKILENIEKLRLLSGVSYRAEVVRDAIETYRVIYTIPKGKPQLLKLPDGRKFEIERTSKKSKL